MITPIMRNIWRMFMISKQFKKYAIMQIYKMQFQKESDYSNYELLRYYNNNDFFKIFHQNTIPLNSSYIKIEEYLDNTSFEPPKNFIQYYYDKDILNIKHNKRVIFNPFHNLSVLYEYLNRKVKLSLLYNTLVSKYDELNDKKYKLENYEFDKRLHEQYLYYINEEKLDADLDSEEIEDKLIFDSENIWEDIKKEIEEIDSELNEIKSLIIIINEEYATRDFESYEYDTRPFSDIIDFDDNGELTSILLNIWIDFPD